MQHEAYQAMEEDCRAIMTEGVFTSRWAIVEMYHHLGERIGTDALYTKHARGNGELRKGLAKSLGLSDRTVQYAIQFYTHYPQLDTVPEGKNISWNKLVTKYLPAPEGEKAKPVSKVAQLQAQIERLKELLRRCEWAFATHESDPGFCPACKWSHPAHAPDCELKAALDG